MNILDQYFVYHPEPWQDRDRARLSGLPLEEVWFQAADGAWLFDWYAEAQRDIGLSVFIFNYHGTGGVREDRQRKTSTEGALSSTSQLKFLEAIRQLKLRCRRLSDLIWTAPPQQRCGHARGG